MATIFQTLLVELQARDERFAAVLTRVENRLDEFGRSIKVTSQRIETGFSGIQGAIGKVTNALGLLVSVAALGGVTKLAKDALDAAGTIVDFADRVGIGTEQLQALQFAASQAGVSTEEFNTGITRFSKNLAAANSGVKSAQDLFQALGLNIKELGKDPAKALETVADRLAKVENQSQRVQIALELFGKGGGGFVNFLQTGSGEMQRMTERARSLGIVIEDGLLRQSEALGDELEVASKVMSTQLQQALLSIAPLLVSAATSAANFAKGIAAIAQAVGLLNTPLRQQITDTSKRVFDLQQHLQNLQDQQRTGVGNVLPQFLDQAINKTTSDIAKLTGQLSEMQNEFARSQPTLKASATEWVQLGDSVDKTAKAKEKATKATKDINEGLKEQLTVLQKQDALLDQAIAGTLDWAQAQVKLAAVQKTSGGQDAQLAESVAALEARIKEKTKAIEASTVAWTEQYDQLQQNLQQQAELQQGIENELKQNTRLTAVLQEGVETQRGVVEIERTLAIEREKARLVTQHFTGDILAQAEALVTSREALAQAEQGLDAYKRGLEGGIDVTRIFQDGVRGLAQGTLFDKNFFKQQGLALATEFGNAFLFGKQNTLDKGFKLNVNQLVGGNSGGLIGAIMGQGGQNVASSFSNSFLTNFLPNPSQIGQGIKDVLASLSIGGSGIGAGLQNLFNGLGNLGSGLLGNSIGGLIGSAFGLKGGGLGGSIGGLVGGIAGSFFGPAGSAIGAAIGNIFGSFIQSLFKHIPTKGTQIRKAVKEYLKDIGVSFASELDTKDYFFKETKDLAKDLYGGDFLKASKDILRQKTGPELARELSAIGAVLTAEEAKKLGKSAEQTATTFGNLLAANLGTDSATLNNALNEITEKAGLTFESVVTKLNQMVKDSQVSLEFYQEAIAGTISLFNDLPKAIDATKLAAKSMSAEGVLDLEKFRKELEKATSQYEAIAGAFASSLDKRIAENLTGSETKEAFLLVVKDSLRNAAIARFIEEELPKLFEGIDLTEPINLSSEAMQKLAEKVGIAADQLYELLKAAGLLPDVLKDSVDVATDFVAEVKKLDQEIAAIATRRVAIRIDFIDRLAAIGSLDPLKAIDLKAQALNVQADSMLKAAEAAGGLGTLTLDQLNELLDVQDNLASLMVDRYNAEAQAIEANGQIAIQQIQAQYAAQAAGIQATIQGLEASKASTQQYFQEIEQGLQEQLQVAQAFQSVATQLKSSIAQLVTGPQSALSRPEQAAFLERQIAELRSQPFTAESAAQLGELIQQQLSASVNQQGSVAFFDQFNSVIADLETVQKQTASQGDKALELQAEIKQVQMQSFAALASIDQQIASQQQALAQLSLDEQYAVQRAQEAVNRQIDDLRRVTADALLRNGLQQERIAVEAQLKREEQRRIAFEQLVKQVGVEEATRLVADQNVALLYTMIQSRDILNSIDATLSRIIPAANGFEGVVSRPQLFLAGERGPEYVSVTPRGATRGGGMAVSINAPLTVHLSGQATEEDGRRLSRGYIEALKAEIRHGDLGTTIVQRVR